MKKLIVVCICVVAFSAGMAIAWAADDKASPKPPTTSPGFDALKKLAGEWTTPSGPDGKPASTKFRLSAGGSVLVETLFPDTPHEMVTMYHMDGPDLILTHYCMLGNQPRLKAESAKDSQKLSFKSVGGTNMKMTDAHMGQAVITLVDDDHFEADWCSCVNGKADTDHHFVAKFTRKK